MDRDDRERVGRRKRNPELEAHLLRKGTDPETARWLAEQSEPDEDGAPGQVAATSESVAERTARLMAMGFPVEQAEEYARNWDEAEADVSRAGEVEATIPAPCPVTKRGGS